MRRDYDIYVVAHVEELKEERARLEQRVRELVRENAELSMLLERERRRSA